MCEAKWKKHSEDFFFHVWNWEEKWESGEKSLLGTNVLIHSKHSLKPNFFSPLGFHTWKLSFLIPKNTIAIFTPKKNWGTFKDFASIFFIFFLSSHKHRRENALDQILKMVHQKKQNPYLPGSKDSKKVFSQINSRL